MGKKSGDWWSGWQAGFYNGIFLAVILMTAVRYFGIFE